MSEITLRVDARENLGSNASRRFRREDLIPAVVYGGSRPSVPIVVDRKKVLDLLASETGENTVFLLTLGESGKSRHAMIRDLQVNPQTRQVQHIDFVRINMTDKVQVAVAVELTGTAVGVKTDGGMLDFITREVHVECLPANIPQQLEADISELHVGQHLEAGEIPMPDGVTLVDEPGRVIIAVAAARLAAEEEETEEGDGLIESEAAEPAVIGRTTEED